MNIYQDIQIFGFQLSCLICCGIICTVLALAAPTLRWLLLAVSLMCSVEDVIKQVNILCGGIRNSSQLSFNYSIGVKLCEVLCSEDLVSHISCHTWHLSKPVVFTLRQPKGTMVVKSATDSKEEIYLDQKISQNEFNVYWQTDEDFIPTEQEVTNLLLNNIQSVLGYVPTDTQLHWLLNGFKLYGLEGCNDINCHRTFWKLINDQEFMMTAMYNGQGIFPSLVGTCGEYYAVEYAHPLTKSAALLPYDMSVGERLQAARQLVAFVMKLDHVEVRWQGKDPVISNQVLHLCDVKPDHFGWMQKIISDDPDEVRFLDLDTVMTSDSLANTLVNTVCANSEDCNFFDCHGTCNVSQSRCQPDRINSNLQVLCKKVFLGHTDSRFFSVHGLLDFAADQLGHLTVKLNEALQICQSDAAMPAEIMIFVISDAIQDFESTSADQISTN